MQPVSTNHQVLPGDTTIFLGSIVTKPVRRWAAECQSEEDGWTDAMLMSLSGHTNLRSLGICINPSVEVVAAAEESTDLG